MLHGISHFQKGRTAMTSKEAKIYQLKNLKGKPLKQKIEYILTYFGISILVTLAVLGFAISYIVHIVTVKDYALTVTCVNTFASQEEADEYAREFAAAAGIDTDEYEVYISGEMLISNSQDLASYEAAQALAAKIATRSIDVMAADLETMTAYLYQNFLADLTQVLTPQQQEEYAPYFLYMDMAFINALEEASGTVAGYPDPTKPEEMEAPVPVALLLPENGTFTGLFYPYWKNQSAVGIVVNSLNTPNALAFVNYIME